MNARLATRVTRAHVVPAVKGVRERDFSHERPARGDVSVARVTVLVRYIEPAVLYEQRLSLARQVVATV